MPLGQIASDRCPCVDRGIRPAGARSGVRGVVVGDPNRWRCPGTDSGKVATVLGARIRGQRVDRLPPAAAPHYVPTQNRSDRMELQDTTHSGYAVASQLSMPRDPEGHELSNRGLEVAAWDMLSANFVEFTRITFSSSGGLRHANPSSHASFIVLASSASFRWCRRSCGRAGWGTLVRFGDMARGSGSGRR